ncbi:MAG: YfiR family protein, partial [Verrucomicrobiota bacterium]
MPVGNDALRRRRFSVCQWMTALLGWILLAQNVDPARAQTPSEEYKLKAVFLFNFVQYVDWPDSKFSAPDSPIVIGVLGANPFGEVLEETVANETVKKRKIVVEHYRSVKEIKDCQVLFISASESRKLYSTLARLKNRNILTVSDIDLFSEDGGMIGFMTENNKIRFQINQEVAKKS